MTRYEPVPSSMANVAKCPHCKYDLRSHITSPMPMAVRCPECGIESATATILGLKKRPRHPLLWKILLPPPVFILVSLVIPYIAFIVIIFWPIAIGLFLGHLAWVAVVAARNDKSPSRWDRFESGSIFAGLAFIYDAAVLAATVGLLAWSQFRFHI